MGNVNAREGGCSDSLEQGIAAPVEAHGVSVSPSDLMGQTPPHSPRATQSPLMFTPQVSSFSLYLGIRIGFLLPVLI